MKTISSKLFVGVAALLMALMLADTNYAQRRNRGAVYSKEQVEQLLERIEETSDDFTKWFDEALDDSRLDTTRTEENYTDLSRDLENVTDELRREFDHNDTRGETSANVRKVLNAASVIDRIMKSRNFGAQAESSWLRFRSELNALAKIYGLPVVSSTSYRAAPARVTRSVPTTGRRAAYSKEQIEQLLERIEERTDAFTKRFDEALDDSRLDTTRTEENYTDRSRDLENVTDELRREFDHNDTRGETSANVRKVLNVASDINRIMNSRNFGRQTEATWTALRAELNALARIYGLSVVGSKSYR
jgi:regulator of sigma D